MSDDLLSRYHFDPREFATLQGRYRSGSLSLATNLITFGNDWQVRLPRPEDTVPLPGGDSPEAAAGAQVLAAGRFGMILMNGGAATRFQRPGENLPKGAFEIMEEAGRPRSFMEIKLAHARWAEKEFGGRIPVWILNSYFTDEATRRILAARGNFGKNDLFTYCQGIMKRVVPSAPDIRAHYAKALAKASGPGKEALESFVERWMAWGKEHAGDELPGVEGEDRFNPPGHLDTTLWLLLDPSRPVLKMLSIGIEYLFIANIDNLGATVDPALPGLLERRSEAAGILCEVSLKPPGQKGGTLARVYDPASGREWPQIIEEFAFPPGFNQDAIPDFNNATYTVPVSALLELFGLTRETLEKATREELKARVDAFTARLPVYVAIKELKKAGGVVPVVQFERLQGDLTRLLKPLAVRTRGRFFPVKQREDIPVMVPPIREALSGRLILEP